jgi:hypothetical protein
MVIRLLAFDPDPRGRRLIQEGCASLGDGCRLCLRTTASACARELRSGRYDGLLLGMPIASTDLFALMLSCQTLECPPTILLVGETRGDALIVQGERFTAHHEDRSAK